MVVGGFRAGARAKTLSADEMGEARPVTLPAALAVLAVNVALMLAPAAIAVLSLLRVLR
jgi:hypothetical protein